jgi:parvulin-like peptidyl-prolyl isomerase
LRKRLFLLAAFSLSLRAELIDKLAITVGQQVITELGIDEDLRVVALINGEPVNRSLDARRAAADRLVQRLLIQHEMEVSRYPLPTDQEVATYLQQVETTVGGDAAFPNLLKSYSLTQPTLVNYLKAQLTMLRFIEYRFSPDISVSDADIDLANQTEHPGVQPPLLTQAKRDAISQKLTEERTDAALNTWLAESRKQINIVYLDTELQ